MRRKYNTPTEPVPVHNEIERRDGYTNIHTHAIGVLLDNDSVWNVLKYPVMSLCNFDPFMYADLMKAYTAQAADVEYENLHQSTLFELGLSWVNFVELAEQDIQALEDENDPRLAIMPCKHYSAVIAGRLAELEAAMMRCRARTGMVRLLEAQQFVQDTVYTYSFNKEGEYLNVYGDIYHVWNYNV